ncbi:MAG TPA: hypothetical protein PKC76_01005 [Saprospiraceae bacterium]|nr:hypothetical protein [Saprospiraceae bacterium]HMP22671.1 hypothetical protein [Saprospiraceae bacterium]
MNNKHPNNYDVAFAFIIFIICIICALFFNVQIDGEITAATVVQ